MKNYDIIYNKKYNEVQPLVSIITSNYNRREELVRAIESIKKQSFTNIEYILVDNGSTVNNDDIAYTHLNDEQIPMMYIKKEYTGGM